MFSSWTTVHKWYSCGQIIEEGVHCYPSVQYTAIWTPASSIRSRSPLAIVGDDDEEKTIERGPRVPIRAATPTLYISIESVRAKERSSDSDDLPFAQRYAMVASRCPPYCGGRRERHACTDNVYVGCTRSWHYPVSATYAGFIVRTLCRP